MLLSRLNENVSRKQRGVTRDVTPSDSQGGLIDNHFIDVLNYEDGQPLLSRSDGVNNYLHVSAYVNGFCPRQAVLQQRFNTSTTDVVTGGHRVVWAIGRAIEKHIRDSYIKHTGGKDVYGKWSCNCGRVKYEGFKSNQVGRCVACRSYADNYGEVDLISHEVGLAGHPDFIFRLSNGKLVIVEIKSIKVDTKHNNIGFKDLKEPLANHVLQAAAYRRLFKEAGFDVYDKILIVYAAKDFVYGSPYKSYPVDVTKGHWEGSLDRMWQEALTLKTAFESGSTPSRVCPSCDSPIAKKCSISTTCFAMD